MKKNNNEIKGNWPYVSMSLVYVIQKVIGLSKNKHRNERISHISRFLLPLVYSLNKDCRQDELIRIGLFGKSTVSREIERLKADGVIDCYSDPEYGYFNRIRLTEKGEESALQIFDSIFAWERKIKEVLSDGDWNLLRRASKTICDNLNSLSFDANIDRLSGENSTYALLMAANAIGDRITRFAENYTLLSSQIHILMAVGISGGSCTFKKAESYVILKQSGLVKQVKKLCDLGYLETYVDKNDRRAKWIKATAKGHQMIERLLISAEFCDKKILEGLNDSEKAELLDLLRKFEKAIDIASL